MADVKNKKVSIEVEVDTSNAIKQLNSFKKTIDSSLKKVDFEIKLDTTKVNNAVKTLSNESNKAAKKFAESFSKSFDDSGKKVKNLSENIKKVLQSLSKDGSNIGASFANQFVNTATRIIRAKMSLFKSVSSGIIKGMAVAIRGSVSIINNAMNHLANSIVKGLDRVGQKARNVARNMGATLSNALKQTIDLSINANLNASGGNGGGGSQSGGILNAGLMAASLKAITDVAIKNSMPKEAGNAAAAFASKLIDAGQKLLILGKVAYQSYTLIRSNWPRIVDTFKTISTNIKPILEAGLQMATQGAKTALTAGLRLASDAFSKGIQRLCDSPNKYFNALGKAIRFIAERIIRLVNTFSTLNDASNFVKSHLIEFAKQLDLGTSVKELKGLFDTLVQSVKQVGKAFSPYLLDIAKSIVSAFNALISPVKEIVKLVSNVLTIFSPLLKLLKTMFDRIAAWANLLGSVLKVINDFISKVREALTKVVDFFVTPLAKLDDLFTGLINTLARGINALPDLFDKLTKAINGACEKIKDSAKRTWDKVKEFFGLGNKSESSSDDSDSNRGYNSSGYTEYSSSSSSSSSKNGIGVTYKELDNLISDFNEKVRLLSDSPEELLKLFEDFYGGFADLKGLSKAYDEGKKESTNKALRNYISKDDIITKSNMDSNQRSMILNKTITSINQAVETYKKALKNAGDAATNFSKGNEFDSEIPNIDFDYGDIGEVKVTADIDVKQEDVEKVKIPVDIEEENKESLIDKIKSVDDAIQAYSKFESKVKAVIHPVKTLKSELAKKITVGTIKSIAKDAENATKSFNKLKVAVKEFKNASTGSDKVSAGLKVLSSSAQLAFNKLKVIFKTNAIGKLIERMKGPTEKASKKLADKVPGGKDTIGLFKGALGKLAILFGGFGLASFFKTAANEAITLESSIIQLNRRLGESAVQFESFATGEGLDLGLSRQNIAEFGNNFSIFVSKFESDSTRATETTIDLLEAAAKTAQATGYDMQTVMESFRSALTGSSEAVDQYGLSMKTANLEVSESFKQVANGVESWDKLTQAQQQQIIAMEMIRQTNDNFGNGMKTSSSIMLKFQAVLNNVKLALGNTFKVIMTAVLPPLTALLQTLEVVLNKVTQFVTTLLELAGIKVSFTSGFGDVASLAGNVGNTADSVDAIGESADNAAESAKELKGELAG